MGVVFMSTTFLNFEGNKTYDICGYENILGDGVEAYGERGGMHMMTVRWAPPC